jgi:quercetin dioxygenase-like cupin family protein
MLITRMRMLGAICAIVVAGLEPSRAQTSVPKVTSSVLKQVPVGELRGKWDMKATMLVIEPGGQIPFHIHRGPGLRYVLEGAITINWREGKTQTYEAGSTYFEGPGENHPAGTMSAKNSGQGRCRVVIVELIPES